MGSTFIIKASLNLMHYSGAAALLASSFRGMGAIFCLHQVRPQSTSAFRPNYQLEITPEFLDMVIKSIKSKGYGLVSLAEAVEIIKKPEKSSAPFAAFTLDDGYIDNAEFAAAVFRAHNSPYTIFVSPGYAEANSQLWWRDVELIAAKIGTNTAERHRLFNGMMKRALSLGEDEQRSYVQGLARAQHIDQRQECRNMMMSWNDIRVLNKDPLCEIGAHTMNHFALKRLTEDRAFQEMTASKAVIEKELGEKVRFFAYPYGAHDHADSRDFALAAKAGFEASVTTRKGVIKRGHGNHLQALPRVMVSGRYQRSHYLTTLVSGLPFGFNRSFRELDVR